MNGMNEEIPETLYHYCSLPTFLNIIRNKSIWVSDIECSNDSWELVSLRNLIARRIGADLNEIIHKNMLDDGDHELAKKLFGLKDGFMENLSTVTIKTFAFCLSEERDLLSQWRGYADDGNGVAIGFKTEFFNRLCKKNTEKETPAIFDFDKITYDEGVAKEYIADLLAKFKWYQCSTLDDYKEALKNIYAKISADAPFYKKDGFSEEKEWRFVIDFLVKKIGLFSLSETNDELCTFGEIIYEARGNRLVPHIEIKISDITNAISEIIIGPKCKEKEADILHFLVCSGALKSIYDPSIKITKTATSYR